MCGRQLGKYGPLTRFCWLMVVLFAVLLTLVLYFYEYQGYVKSKIKITVAEKRRANG